MSCGGNLGYILELLGDGHSKPVFVQRHQDSCLVEGNLSNLHEAWQGNMDASQGEAGDPVSLSICHSDIGIPINFQAESSLDSF